MLRSLLFLFFPVGFFFFDALPSERSLLFFSSSEAFWLRSICIRLGGIAMSGGSVRQRCNQGYASSGDDLEDDACSRMTISSSSSLLVVRRPQSWVDVLENIIWLLSAAFIFYYGDRRQNFLRVLLLDSRINRKALHLGLVAFILDVGLIIYIVLQAKVSKNSYDKNEALRTILPIVILLGLISFCLLSYGLWPIWGFLTIPLLFTLLMASMVVLTYLLFERLRSQSATTRTD